MYETTMTKDYKFIALWLLSTLLITACSNDGADGSGVTNPNEQTSEEIRFNIKNWQVMQGTPRRAQTYNGESDIKNETEGFRCFIYNGNSTTSYNSNEGSVVKWNLSTSKWEFQDGKHYWPMSGNLDFFAYMPATKPNYISNFSYTTARNPQITCTNLPMTYNSASPEAGQGSDLQEFIYAMVTDQNKAGQGESGVELTFAHPFARIKLKLSSTQANIHINTITFKDLKKSGTCSFNGTTSIWTPTGDATNFVVTLDDDYNANAVLGTDYIMIPQTWSGVIEVNAIWTDWDESVAHTVSVTLPELQRTWAPGTNYTYTFTITETDLIVNTSKYTEQW